MGRETGSGTSLIRPRPVLRTQDFGKQASLCGFRISSGGNRPVQRAKFHRNSRPSPSDRATVSGRSAALASQTCHTSACTAPGLRFAVVPSVGSTTGDPHEEEGTRSENSSKVRQARETRHGGATPTGAGPTHSRRCKRCRTPRRRVCPPRGRARRRRAREAHGLPGRIPMVSRHETSRRHRVLHARARGFPGAGRDSCRVPGRLRCRAQGAADCRDRSGSRWLGRWQRTRRDDRI
jgi:hypothetical protein